MAVLALVRASIEDTSPDADLAWLSLDDAPGAIAVEASYGDGRVFLTLPRIRFRGCQAQGSSCSSSDAERESFVQRRTAFTSGFTPFESSWQSARESSTSHA